MTAIGQYALTGNILASVIGGLLLSVLILKYGFVSPLAQEPDQVMRRVLFTRLGHAAAAVCFAAAVMLGIVALGTSAQRGATVPTSPELARVQEDVRALDARVRALEDAIREMEANLSRSLSRIDARPTR